MTGHRPTWKMGVNGKQPDGAEAGRVYPGFGAGSDPFGMFTDFQSRASAHRAGARRAHDPQRRAQGARCARARRRCHGARHQARFKMLVKRHHPDANGGDRTCEDKLREIIQAYNYLKSVGFC